jgi:cytochrome c553
MGTMTSLFTGLISLIFSFVVFGHADAGPFDSPGATKALVCSACHGFGGNSPGDTVPILAGMEPAYFKKAIKDYAEGRRPSPEMEPFAKMVLQSGLDEIASYFAEQKRRSTRIKLDPAAVSRGKTLSLICAVCHGPQGKGDPEKLIPNLRGQPPGYLVNQMFLFKQDKRNPADQTLIALKGLMKLIPEKTFADLAAYYSSLK